MGADVCVKLDSVFVFFGLCSCHPWAVASGSGCGASVISYRCTSLCAGRICTPRAS